ncbi:MAG TPA: hypothetical protein VGK19_18295 [Capsulimonadaceae bacterium]|jgi:hypothetical protein
MSSTYKRQGEIASHQATAWTSVQIEQELAFLINEQIRPHLDIAVERSRGITEIALPLLVETLSQSEIVYWDLNQVLAATAGAEEAFRGESLADSDVPTNAQFWVWNGAIRLEEEVVEKLDINVEHPLELQSSFVVPFHILVDATAAWCGISHQEVIADNPFLAGNGVVQLWVLMPPPEYIYTAYAERLPGHETLIVPHIVMSSSSHVGGDVSQASSVYIAMRRYMQQPFIDAELEHFDRAQQRRYKRERRNPPKIRVIKLRRRMTRQDDHSQNNGTYVRREYGCHFLVSGHWRRANRRMKNKRPVYVRQSVKGNLDKPFKVPTKTIWVVDR